MHINDLLVALINAQASDLHLMVGHPPFIRLHGDLTPMPQVAAFSEPDLKTLLFSILTEEQVQHFEYDPNARFELDFAYGLTGVGRFRFNIHKQRGTLGATVRALSSRIPSFEEIGAPPIIKEIIRVKKGMILVTGPTGSGKSTTLAAIIDYINSSEPYHILTIEDPVEYMHQSKKSLVTQREVGPASDTLSFKNALKYALRQDPDVILIGEMRDPETIEIALTSAETGHLVFGTLHTSSAAQTVNRIIDVFPADKQPLIITQLAANLQSVLSQILLQRADGNGRALAMEIMRCTPAIRNGIRMNKIETINQTIQTGSTMGMQSMDQCIVRLVASGIVARDTAEPYIKDEVGRRELEELAVRGSIPENSAPPHKTAAQLHRPADPPPRPAPPAANPAAANRPVQPAQQPQDAKAAPQRLGRTVIPPWEQQ
ncbi:type IV pilus twitching motility protein PilT [Candidatus Sumerlaeota bacterium]|nr:type IV pilus twitching motility protein PilT [Candidatus Sumerlaeota bacterium]